MASAATPMRQSGYSARMGLATVVERSAGRNHVINQDHKLTRQVVAPDNKGFFDVGDSIEFTQPGLGLLKTAPGQPFRHDGDA